jgi:hypothetical protein
MREVTHPTPIYSNKAKGGFVVAKRKSPEPKKTKSRKKQPETGFNSPQYKEMAAKYGKDSLQARWALDDF